MKLTEREKDICRYLVEGKNNNEIAKILFLSQHTVKAYVSSIIAHLGAKNRTHVAYILGKENIINL
ncbi:response regulator transcription factor [bacterium]|nr:response regulator transcription factor [bacterium]